MKSFKEFKEFYNVPVAHQGGADPTAQYQQKIALAMKLLDQLEGHMKATPWLPATDKIKQIKQTLA